MATFTISDDDSLYTLPIFWKDLVDYFKHPRRVLARNGILGEDNTFVRFEYGRAGSFRGDVLLQGIESKRLQTAYVKPSKSQLSPLGDSDLAQIGRVVVGTVDITMRSDCNLAFGHIKLDPEQLSDLEFLKLLARNPRLVVESICKVTTCRLKRPGAPNFTPVKPGELRFNPRHNGGPAPGSPVGNPRLPSAAFTLELGEPIGAACCTCATSTSAYSEVTQSDGSTVVVLDDIAYAFTQYCPCQA